MRITGRKKFGTRTAANPPSNVTVLHVITDLGGGGAEAMLARLVIADQQRGSAKNVVVTLLDGGIHVRTLREAGIEVHGLGLDRFSRFPFALVKLVAIIRQLRPKLVMTWLYHADLLGTLAAVASGLGVGRVIWNIRCSNLDFSHYAYTTRLIVKLLAWASPLPKLVATNSLEGRRAHEKLGYRPRNWILLPNGLDTREYRPDKLDRLDVRSELEFNKETFAVGMIARADPQKDHDTFLAAATAVRSKFPHVRFVLVGRDTHRFSGSDHVISLGERRDVPRLLRGLDLVVLSSAYGEGTPNIIAEAMATGIPCIATDVGDSAFLVGSWGIVVPPKKPKELAAAIETLVQENSERRGVRCREGREAIHQGHNIDRTVRIYREIRDAFLQNREAPQADLAA
jgi:glycosyltransferase involved in cell wall biosynthesis